MLLDFTNTQHTGTKTYSFITEFFHVTETAVYRSEKKGEENDSWRIICIGRKLYLSIGEGKQVSPFTRFVGETAAIYTDMFME
jgi:hypothetical protein